MSLNPHAPPFVPSNVNPLFFSNFDTYLCTQPINFLPYHLPLHDHPWWMLPSYSSPSSLSSPNQTPEEEVRRNPHERGVTERRRCMLTPRLRYLWRRPCDQKTTSEEYEFREETRDDVRIDGKTTVMIKNIPNQYSREMLLSLLDKHCLEENRKLKQEVMASKHLQQQQQQQKQQPVLSAFNFFYLPVDFGTGNNLGYAFVNFTSGVAAWRLHQALHNRKWSNICSRKICEVTYARIQGLEALKSHFQGSTFDCNSIELLPCLFVPPRNGKSRCQKLFIGRREQLRPQRKRQFF